MIGAKGSAAEAIRARVERPSAPKNLLSIDPQAVADQVAGLPQVRSVQVDRAFPRELRIRVVTERAAAIVETGTSRYTIARSGRVMGDAPKASKSAAAVGHRRRRCPSPARPCRRRPATRCGSRRRCSTTPICGSR